MNFDFYSYFFSSFAHITILVLAGSVLLQLIYHWVIFSRLAFKKQVKLDPVSHPVSVIVCARNEYQNLKDFLPIVLNQDYPIFEVILVNDDSDDETEFLMRDLLREYPHFRVVNINRAVSFIKGKKFALSIGIKEAKYNHILLTDADCKPVSLQWIQTMQQGFTHEKQLVLGYGRYEKSKGLLNRLVRFDTVNTAMQYLSYSLFNHPYMGVGRNLSYTKQLFEQHKGFTSHYAIPYGDDDLFVNKVAKGKNTIPIYSVDGQTESIAPKTWGNWFRQKKRHLDTGRYYRFATKFSLSLNAASALLFYVAFVVSLVFAFHPIQNIDLIIVGSLFLVRSLSLIIIFANVCKKLNEKGLAWMVLFFDLIFVVLNPIWSFSNVIFKQNKWK